MNGPQRSHTAPATDGVQLYFENAGDLGRPEILFLHGIAGSRRYWTPRALPLARNRRLLIPDLPGFGHSPKPHVDYTPAFFSETIERYLRQNRSSDAPLTIVGHSLGALLAVELAVRQPTMVGALVLISTPRFPCPASAHQILLEGSSSYRRLLTVESVDKNFSHLRRLGWRGAFRHVTRLPWGMLSDTRKFTFRSLSSTLENCVLNASLDPTLFAIAPSLPILMIHGSLDPVAPSAAILALRDRPPDPEIHVLPGAGHNPFHTHTFACLQLVTRFLDRSAGLARTEAGP